MRTKMADSTGWAVTPLSTTAFVLGWYDAELIDPKGLDIVPPVAFIVGGLMHILVAILEAFSGTPLNATVVLDYQWGH